MSFAKKMTYFLLIIILCAASAFTGYAIVKRPSERLYICDPGDYFVTNIVDSKSLLKSDLVFEMSDKKHYGVLTSNIYKVRDIIIYVLRSKLYEEIKNPNIQKVLKAEIKEKIFQEFDGVVLTDIFFGEFVVQ